MLPIAVAAALSGCLQGNALGQGPGSTALPMQPTVRVGALDGPDAFGSVVSVAEGPGNHIYIADGLGHHVRVYDARGRFVRVIGRRGSGPGEFQSIGRISWIGDTLVIADPSLQRYLTFTPNGAFLGSFRPPPGLYITLGVFADRTALVRPNSRHYAASASMAMPLIRVGGDRADTVARTNAYGSGACVGQRIVVCLGSPLGTADLVAVDVEGSHFAVVSGLRAERPGRRSFLVTRFTANGDTAMHVSLSYNPRPVPRSYRDSLVTHWTTLLMNPPGNRPRLTRQEAEATVRDGLQVPDFYPPVYSLTLARNGDIWLETQGVTNRPTWLVLDSNGRHKATIEGPPGLKLHDVSENSAWGVITGEMDVPYVVGLRLPFR